MLSLPLIYKNICLVIFGAESIIMLLANALVLLDACADPSNVQKQAPNTPPSFPATFLPSFPATFSAFISRHLLHNAWLQDPFCFCFSTGYVFCFCRFRHLRAGSGFIRAAATSLRCLLSNLILPPKSWSHLRRYRRVSRDSPDGQRHADDHNAPLMIGFCVEKLSAGYALKQQRRRK